MLETLSIYLHDLINKSRPKHRNEGENAQVSSRMNNQHLRTLDIKKRVNDK